MGARSLQVGARGAGVCAGRRPVLSSSSFGPPVTGAGLGWAVLSPGCTAH
jgi:hypothetical protein